MSDLNPSGIPVVLNGVERRFLFTLSVFDAIQSLYGKTVYEVIRNDLTGGGLDEVSTLINLVTILINDEVDRETFFNGGTELKKVTYKEVSYMVHAGNLGDVTVAVLTAYGYSIPEPDENDENQDPNS